MSTPTAPKPYTPQQVLNNLQNFVAELDQYPANEQSGPGYVLRGCQNILKRGIEPPSLPIDGCRFILRRLPNGKLWLQFQEGEGMEVNEVAFSQTLAEFFHQHF